MVHRPRYDDWSFPKGKLAPGETFEEAAVREVEEETGLRCRLLSELKGFSYPDRHGRQKIVRYWLMEVVDGSLEERQPDHEVDQARWVTLEEARELLSYERELAFLDDLLAEGARAADPRGDGG